MNQDRSGPTLEQLLGRLADAFGLQLELQVELAKAELARDTRALGMDLAPALLALPLLGLGYTFLTLGIALVLGLWLGAGGGFLVVGAIHLLGGAGAARLCVLRMRTRSQLSYAHAARQTIREESRTPPPTATPQRFGTAHGG